MRKASLGFLFLFFVGLMVVSPSSNAQSQIRPNIDEPRLNAYLQGSGSTFMVDLIVTRPDAPTRRATVEAFYRFEQFGTVAHTRFNFLSPADVAGDVYIFREDFDSRTRSRDVFFWNDGLVSPIKVNLDFAIFGDATVFDIFGFRLIGYELVDRRDSEEAYMGPQPTTSEEFVMVSGGSIEIKEYDYVPVNEFALFPKVQVLTYNFSLPYQFRLKDENDDLLFTLDYDWRDYMVFEGRRYASKYTIINHIAPGNSTDVFVSDIALDPDLSFSIFDLDQLGQ